MRKLIVTTICAATLLLSGCIHRDVVIVMHETDGSGRRVHSYVKTPSKHAEADKIAVEYAIRRFPAQVHKPLKNHHYQVRVSVLQSVEDERSKKAEN